MRPIQASLLIALFYKALVERDRLFGDRIPAELINGADASRLAIFTQEITIGHQGIDLLGECRFELGRIA